MDRLDAMSIFLVVVEADSLSAASRRLRTPLATVSQKTSELDSHLRTKLFNRSSRKLVLTDAGGSYVAECKGILADRVANLLEDQIDVAMRIGELPDGLGLFSVDPLIRPAYNWVRGTPNTGDITTPKRPPLRATAQKRTSRHPPRCRRRDFS